MWQVVEMMESDFISPVQISVSVVAVKWIKVIDGAFFCLWPETNAARKIKLASEPKAGEKWQLYKCRILMNGAKYNTYVEAREAEKICANETMTLKRQSDDEIVEELYCENKKIKSENFLYQHFAPMELKKSIESDDDKYEGEYLSGNDSFEFNKAMLRGGTYCHYNYSYSDDETSRFIDVERLDSTENKTSTSPKYRRYLENSRADESGYDDFKANVVDRLTSTVVSEQSTSQGNKNLKTYNNEPKYTVDSRNNILIRIRNLECLLSDFTNNVRRELRELKEMTIDCDASKVKEIPSAVEEDQEKTNTGPRKIEILNVEVVKLPDNIKSADSEENCASLAKISTGEEIFYKNQIPPSTNFELPQLQMLLNNTAKVEEPVNNNVEGNLEVANNATFIIPDANVTINTPKPQLPSSELNREKPADDWNPGFPADELDPEVPLGVPFENGILLPIANIPHYNDVERSLLSAENANALKDLTLPMEKEIETKYMDRIFLVLFEKDFLLDSISWKKQENHVDLRGGILLKCWQESYETKFGKNVKDSKFQEHCRRFKSALRAQKKAAGKAEEGAKVKKR